MRIKFSMALITGFLCVLSPVFAQTLPQVTTYEQLVEAIRETRVSSQQRIEALVEQEKVREVWETGKLIDTHVLQHKERANYGEQVIKKLANDLGTSETELRYTLQFARNYPIHPPGDELSWSHYRALLALNDPKEREEVAQEAVRQNWNRDQVREEVRRRKPRSDSEPADAKPAELPEIKSGEPGVYRIVAFPENKQLKIDLGFSTYFDMPEEYAGKFKEGEIIKTVKSEELSVNSEKPGQLFTLHPSLSKELYTYRARVTEVYDGDTFHALIDLGFGVTLEQRLRLRRLDAPEILSAEGKEAKALLEKTLTPEIIVKVSKTDDQYGRYLADVFTSDLVSIDQKLLDSGLFTIREDET